MATQTSSSSSSSSSQNYTPAPNFSPAPPGYGSYTPVAPYTPAPTYVPPPKGTGMNNPTITGGGGGGGSPAPALTVPILESNPTPQGEQANVAAIPSPVEKTVQVQDSTGKSYDVQLLRNNYYARVLTPHGAISIPRDRIQPVYSGSSDVQSVETKSGIGALTDNLIEDSQAATPSSYIVNEPLNMAAVNRQVPRDSGQRTFNPAQGEMTAQQHLDILDQGDILFKDKPTYEQLKQKVEAAGYPSQVSPILAGGGVLAGSAILGLEAGVKGTVDLGSSIFKSVTLQQPVEKPVVDLVTGVFEIPFTLSRAAKERGVLGAAGYAGGLYLGGEAAGRVAQPIFSKAKDVSFRGINVVSDKFVATSSSLFEKSPDVPIGTVATNYQRYRVKEGYELVNKPGANFLNPNTKLSDLFEVRVKRPSNQAGYIEGVRTLQSTGIDVFDVEGIVNLGNKKPSTARVFEPFELKSIEQRNIFRQGADYQRAVRENKLLDNVVNTNILETNYDRPLIKLSNRQANQFIEGLADKNRARQQANLLDNLVNTNILEMDFSKPSMRVSNKNAEFLLEGLAERNRARQRFDTESSLLGKPGKVDITTGNQEFGNVFNLNFLDEPMTPRDLIRIQRADRAKASKGILFSDVPLGGMFDKPIVEFIKQPKTSYKPLFDTNVELGGTIFDTPKRTSFFGSSKGTLTLRDIVGEPKTVGGQQQRGGLVTILRPPEPTTGGNIINVPKGIASTTGNIFEVSQTRNSPLFPTKGGSLFLPMTDRKQNSKPIIDLRINTISSTSGVLQTQQQMLRYNAKIKTDSFFNTDTRIISRSTQTLVPKLDISTRTNQATSTIPKVSTRPTFKFNTKLLQTQNNPPTPPRLVPKLVPSSKPPRRQYRTSESFSSGFNVFLKSGKSFFKIGSGLDYLSAKGLGISATEKNLKRSFTIIPSGTTARTVPYLSRLGRANMFKYRPSRRNPNVFVEKSKFALDTSLEKQLIQSARKTKGSRRRGLF